MKGMGFVIILHMDEGLARWKEMGYETVTGSDPGISPPESKPAGQATESALQKS
jgi:hypothetical protein